MKKFPTFHGSRMFITAFTSARHLSLSWASSIRSIKSHVPFPLLRSYQSISPGPRFSVWTFHSRICVYGEELSAPRPTLKLEDTACWLSATAYSIYSQLHSILEAVPPYAAWGRAMSWWQWPTYHQVLHNVEISEELLHRKSFYRLSLIYFYIMY